MTSRFVGHVKRCTSEDRRCVSCSRFPNPGPRLERLHSGDLLSVYLPWRVFSVQDLWQPYERSFYCKSGNDTTFSALFLSCLRHLNCQ